MIRRIIASAVLAGLLAISVLASTGCAKRHRIFIESNSCWIARIDGQSSSISEECGNVTFRVAGEIQCVSVTNTNDTGYVRVRIDEGQWVESTAPRGNVRACL